MKKQQKRYTSEQEILDAIDHEYQRLGNIRLEVWRLDRLKSLENGLSPADEDALFRHERAARRIEDVSLPKLKRALAAFRTYLMPFTDDLAVVLD